MSGWETEERAQERRLRVYKEAVGQAFALAPARVQHLSGCVCLLTPQNRPFTNHNT